MIGGCEPYSFDFGDREYMAWLEKWLTPEELAERNRRWAWHARLRRLRVLWPLIRFVDWRVRRVDRLAEERGGPAPDPSWKVRMDFGVAKVPR